MGGEGGEGRRGEWSGVEERGGGRREEGRGGEEGRVHVEFPHHITWRIYT